MFVKLYYFDTRGICEPIRMILNYGEIPFEDIRAPLDGFPPTLPSDLKNKCRWGQVPLAEFEGKSLNQSLAITRYFARKTGLIPVELYEAALCDEYVDAVREFMGISLNSKQLTSWYAVVTENDELKKKELLEETKKSTQERFLKVFENIVKSNDGKHLVGNSLTWADIYLAYSIQHFEIILGVKLAEGNPNLQSLLENVMNTPGIKAWIDKRPTTKY